VKSTKEIIHVFVVRIWIEHRDIRDAEPIWRGVIERIDGEETIYFDHLGKLITYFANYIRGIGVKINNRKK
jgi:hypothetical protein